MAATTQVRFPAWAFEFAGLGRAHATVARVNTHTRAPGRAQVRVRAQLPICFSALGVMEDDGVSFQRGAWRALIAVLQSLAGAVGWEEEMETMRVYWGEPR